MYYTFNQKIGYYYKLKKEISQMDNRTFKVAGISTDPKGSTKIRFANDYVARIKILNMRKHTEVNLVELASPMSKKEICEFLASHDKFQSEAAQTAIQSFVKRNLSGDSVMVIEETSAPVEATVTTEQA
jgi:secreted trypsin-like serine protease